MQALFSKVKEADETKMPDFMKLRDEVLVDSLTYYKYVVPACKEAVQDASVFFKNFSKDFEDLDEFVENMPEVVFETGKFKESFAVCE
jgi:hypothetical protein